MFSDEKPVFDGAFVTYAGRTMLRAAGGEVVPGEAPVVPAPPAAAEPPAAPAAPSGPWAADLATRFPDPVQQAADDAFLRESVQPHVTRVETSLAELKPAAALYNDLVTAPKDTFLAIGEELFGEQDPAVHEQLVALFGDPEVPAVTEPDPTTPPARDPADQAAIDWAKQQATQQAYDAELGRVKGLDDYKDVSDEDWELFHPFVASADGDFDQAAAGFKQYLSRVEARYKPAEDPPPPDPAAPVTLDGTTPPAPPVAKDYKNIDEAIEDWFAEERPAAPPVVGSV